MKKAYYLLKIFIISSFSFGQVGINTEDPQAMLDINGNIKIRNVQTVSELNTTDYSILVREENLSGDHEIKGIKVNDLLQNSSAYAAAKNGSWNLLNLGISGTNWSKINLNGDEDTKLGDPDLFNTGVYTVPETGIYSISYEFQLAGGIDLGLLGGKKLGILKNNAVIEEKLFDAVRVQVLTVTLAAVPVTSSTINTLVQLNEGDTITFAVETGGVNLSLLTSSKVSLNIYKI
ncbi:hypothetical protein [Moheibacter sediminis]|uniref:C1q domain-containing protein n=1 Tax=Moheibacter sediminis TaxID=1434700 RepID=A0A1W2B4S6_9FLAO|nr:hypothetical protein [Moheibacter sediminis]SMC67985.1 hypothetical protein SAMN06296427_105270 [Moheibacter sediminis]